MTIPTELSCFVHSMDHERGDLYFVIFAEKPAIIIQVEAGLVWGDKATKRLISGKVQIEPDGRASLIKLDGGSQTWVRCNQLDVRAACPSCKTVSVEHSYNDNVVCRNPRCGWVQH